MRLTFVSITRGFNRRAWSPAPINCHNRSIDTGFLIVHGLGGSGPDHWQTWLAARLADRGLAVAYPGLPDPDNPSLAAWSEALEGELAAFSEPPVVVCHSLGAVLWLHVASRLGRSLGSRALLVAPPSGGSHVAEIEDFMPPPLDPMAVAIAAETTRLVCAPSGDPYCPEGAARLYAEPLGVPADEIHGAAHINPETGYGPWPAVEAWCLDPAAVPLNGRGATSA